MKTLEQPLILIVDDYEDILFHLKIILEKNNFKVETANNGVIALKCLSELKKLPDLIISDIMMPEMDGYEFFKEVSRHPLWNRIPFIFLTAKITPEDIRIGKMLGVDDYLTKPTVTEDLLAVINGKIQKRRNSALMDKKVEELLTNLEIRLERSITKEEKEEIILLYIKWDDIYGPTVSSYYSFKEEFPFSIKQVGVQLFFAANSIYGQGGTTKAEGLLLNIENINKQAYVFFDAYPDKKMRAKEQQYMLVLIAPKINYMDSLLINKIFIEISTLIKQKKEWEWKGYWDKLFEILLNPEFNL